MSLQLAHMLRLKMGWAAPTGQQHEVVLSSRVRLARNLARFPFPSRANAKAYAAVLEASFEAAKKTKPLAKAAYLKLDGLDPVERLFLTERRLASPELASDPKHRGVVVGDREILSVMVNEEDHLRLQAIDSGLCLQDLWEKTAALVDDLGRSIEFARDPEWGWLTACPTNTGTALRVSGLLHLPALAHTGALQGILEGLSRVGMAARGMYGEGTRVLGDFYQISNGTTLGRSEGEFIDEIGRGVAAIVQKELQTRREVADGPHKPRLEDLVWRSLGTLAYARSISFEETMQHLSYLRFALSLGWRLPVGIETLNELTVHAQPAHVQLAAGREAEPAERDVLRAAMLRNKFKVSSAL